MVDSFEFISCCCCNNKRIRFVIHKLSGLKQHQIIILQFWNQKSKTSFAGLRSKCWQGWGLLEAMRAESSSLPLELVERGCLHVTAPGAGLTPVSASATTSPPRSLGLPSSRDPWDRVGSTQMMQDHLPTSKSLSQSHPQSPF